MGRTFNNSSANYLSAGGGGGIGIQSADTTYTISGWINHASSQVSAIYGQGEPGSNNYIQLGIDAGGHGTLESKAVGVTATTAATSTTLSNGVWGHICGVQSSITSRAVYLNGGGSGTSVTSNQPSAGVSTTIGVLQLGSFFNPCNGTIAEVACWNAALDASEIAALVAGFSPLHIRPQSLLNYWPLLGRYSPEIELWRGKGMTINGTVSQADHIPVIYPKRRGFTKFVAAGGVAGNYYYKNHLQGGASL